MYSRPVEFTDDELRVIESFFSGSDTERLEMLSIDQDAKFTMFSRGDYGATLYEIIIVHVPAHYSRVILHPVIEAEPLDDNWVIIKLCEFDVSRYPYVDIWTTDESGKIVLGEPPYRTI